MRGVLIFRHGKVLEYQLAMLISMLPKGYVNDSNYSGLPRQSLRAGQPG